MSHPWPGSWYSPRWVYSYYFIDINSDTRSYLLERDVFATFYSNNGNGFVYTCVTR